MTAGAARSPMTVGELERLLDERFPFAWAEPWDRVGLLVGDPSVAVGRVFVTLDPSVASIEAARSHDANVIVSHHPAFLDPAHQRWPGVSDAADPGLSESTAQSLRWRRHPPQVRHWGHASSPAAVADP